VAFFANLPVSSLMAAADEPRVVDMVATAAAYDRWPEILPSVSHGAKARAWTSQNRCARWTIAKGASSQGSGVACCPLGRAFRGGKARRGAAGQRDHAQPSPTHALQAAGTAT